MPGVATCFALLFATAQFRRYMSAQERELLRLPLEVAIYLDKTKVAASNFGGAPKASTAVFLAHLGSTCLPPTYRQPSLAAARDLQPDESPSLGKRGAWSTDLRHGGQCRQLFALLLCAHANGLAPLAAALGRGARRLQACLQACCAADRSGREELRDSEDGSQAPDKDAPTTPGAGPAGASTTELTPIKESPTGRLQARRGSPDPRSLAASNASPVLEAL